MFLSCFCTSDFRWIGSVQMISVGVKAWRSSMKASRIHCAFAGTVSEPHRMVGCFVIRHCEPTQAIHTETSKEEKGTKWIDDTENYIWSLFAWRNYSVDQSYSTGGQWATSSLHGLILWDPPDMPGYECMIIVAEAIRQKKREMFK